MHSVTWIVPEFNETHIDFDGFKRLKHAKKSAIPPLSPLEHLYQRLGGQGPIPHAALWANYYKLPEHPAWVMVEPIELISEKASQAALPEVYCLGNAHFEISTEELRDWVELFNQDFKTRGWKLYAPHPKRWLLGLDQLPSYQTAPLQKVIHHAIHAHAPACGAAQWNTLMLAFQSGLHAHPHNLARLAKGLPQVNGVWLSGTGECPELVKSANLCVVTEDPEAQALAELAGAQVVSGVIDFHTIRKWMSAENRTHLVVFVPESLSEHFHKHWIEPFWDMFEKKKCRVAKFLMPNTCYDMGKEAMSVLSLF